LTIVSWNVEGILSQSDFDALVRAVGAPEVLCLQEVRVRSSDATAIRSMETTLRGYRCYHSLNRDFRNASFRGGRSYGVATYCSQDLPLRRAYVPDWDREGRMVVTQFADVTVVNVYAVNGTSKPYFDHSLGRIEGDRHAFKRRFQRMVFDHAAGLGDSVVVAADWNVSQEKLDTHPRLRTELPHARARSEFRDLLQASNLVDVYRWMHPRERGYTWFNRRSRALDAARVDFFLISKDLLPLTTSVRILDDPIFRVRTDHAPIELTVASLGQGLAFEERKAAFGPPDRAAGAIPPIPGPSAPGGRRKDRPLPPQDASGYIVKESTLRRFRRSVTEITMDYRNEKGAAGKGLLLWLLGIPLPVIVVLWLLGVFH